MRRLKFLIVSTMLAVGASGAPAGQSVVLDFQGYAWESGSFPPSAPGDRLSIPCIVTDLSDILQIDLQEAEVTGWIADLVSQGSTDSGGGLHSTRYSGGTLSFYRDAAKDHAFAPDPPNAQVPASFVNGTLCLGGTLESFELFFDTNAGNGAFEARVVFNAGDCLAKLRALRAEGFTFGGVLSPAAAAGNVPAGYDLQVDGLVQSEGVGLETCPFDCFALTEAEFLFPRDAGNAFSTSKFEIEGAFTPCEDFDDLDPEEEDIIVRIGTFTQTLPAGSLERQESGKDKDDDDDGDKGRGSGKDKDDDDGDEDKGRGRGKDKDDDDDDDDDEDKDTARWRYKNPNDFGRITELLLEEIHDGVWEFEIEGRRAPKRELLPNGRRLEVFLAVGPMSGTANAKLKERKNKLSFEGDDRPCGGGDKAVPALPAEPAVRPAPVAARLELGPMAPNPFNARVTLHLRAQAPEPVRLALYDSRGRLVRVLLAGVVGPGEQRLVWDGTDARGVAQASGVYIVRLEAPDVLLTRKLVLAK